MRWLGATSASWSNQNAVMAVSTRPLSGMGSVEHDVEGGDAVGGDHQQPVVAGVVDVADLAGVEEVHRGNVAITGWASGR